MILLVIYIIPITKKMSVLVKQFFLWLQIDDSIVMQNFSLKQTLLCVYSDLLATIKTVTSHLHSLFDT